MFLYRACTAGVLYCATSNAPSSLLQRPPPDGAPAQDSVRILGDAHARQLPPTVPRAGIGAGRRLDRRHDWQPGGAAGDEAAPGPDVVQVDEVASEQRSTEELRRDDHQVGSAIVLFYIPDKRVD